MTIDLEAADCKGYLDVFFFSFVPLDPDGLYFAESRSCQEQEVGCCRLREVVTADCAKLPVCLSRQV